MRQRLVVGNWKMHGSRAMLREFLHKMQEMAPFTDVQMAICPPTIYLHEAQFLRDEFGLSAIALGAQDVSAVNSGAYTGQISAVMLREQGCQYVIVGHSERRQYLHETNEEVVQKAIRAREAGLMPIVCVGEGLDVYQAQQTQAFIVAQLDPLISAIQSNELDRCVVAYEPIWAIGTGLAATAAYASQVHGFIREQFAKVNSIFSQQLTILYGGSVKPDNAAQLFHAPDIDGGLIGGASLQPAEFMSICKAMR